MVIRVFPHNCLEISYNLCITINIYNYNLCPQANINLSVSLLLSAIILSRIYYVSYYNFRQPICLQNRIYPFRGSWGRNNWGALYWKLYTTYRAKGFIWHFFPLQYSNWIKGEVRSPNCFQLILNTAGSAQNSSESQNLDKIQIPAF